MEDWTRVWVGICCAISGNVIWGYSQVQTGFLSTGLLLLSIVLNTLGIVLIVWALFRTLSRKAGIATGEPVVGQEASAPPVVTSTGEELDRLWRRGPGLQAVVLVVAGPVIAVLGVWWIDLVLYSHISKAPVPVGVGFALLLFACAGFLSVVGTWVLMHRPASLEVSSSSLRVEHVGRAPIELSWDARPLKLSVTDGRAVPSALEGAPTCSLTVGRYLSYAVPPRVVDAILVQLSDHHINFDVRSRGPKSGPWKVVRVNLS